METKGLVAIFYLLFCCCALFAENIYVDVKQNVQIPGGQYALDLPSPYLDFDKLPNIAAPEVKFSELKNGILNLRYNYQLKTKKDNKNSLIDCKIEFPSKVSYIVTAFDGIQGYEFGEEQVPALVEHTTYAEFFIPVRKNGSGFIEIQLSIPRNYVGSDIPIKINFEGYKGKTKVLAGVETVPIVFEIFKTVYFASREKVSAVNEEGNEMKRPDKVTYFAGCEKVSAQIIEHVKDKYKKFPLSDSLKRYRVQIR